MTILVPGFTWVQNPKSAGHDYIGNTNYKLVLHTTETDSGAYSMAKVHSWPPHMWVDPETKEKYQNISLDRAAFALARKDATETNKARAIQIEIVGRAATTQDWPIEWYNWLADEVVGPVCRLMNINTKTFKETYGAGQGIVLASASSPIRMKPAEWYIFNGICAHQHVYGNDHWDCGDFNIQAVVTRINGTVAPIVPPKPVDPPAVVNPPSSYYPVIKEGSTGPAVSDLQTRLSKRGYSVSVDGAFGPKTTAIVKDFQKEAKIAVDGIVGPGTWKAIEIAEAWNWKKAIQAPAPAKTPRPLPTLRKGSKGPQVAYLQHALNRVTGIGISADGVFGTGTENALKGFQKFNGLTADGVYGPATAAKLDAWLTFHGA